MIFFSSLASFVTTCSRVRALLLSRPDVGSWEGDGGVACSSSQPRPNQLTSNNMTVGFVSSSHPMLARFFSPTDTSVDCSYVHCFLSKRLTSGQPSDEHIANNWDDGNKALLQQVCSVSQ